MLGLAQYIMVKDVIVICRIHKKPASDFVPKISILAVRTIEILDPTLYFKKLTAVVCLSVRSFVHSLNILKRKSFATLTKMLFPSF